MVFARWGQGRWKIQASLDGIWVEKAVKKGNGQDDPFPGVNIQGKKINIDPTVLYLRLIVLTQLDDYIQDYFAYKLMPDITVLFKDGLMRKPRKTKLCQYLLNKRTNIITNKNEVCVGDGEALFHNLNRLYQNTLNCSLIIFHEQSATFYHSLHVHEQKIATRCSWWNKMVFESCLESFGPCQNSSTMDAWLAYTIESY